MIKISFNFFVIFLWVLMEVQLSVRSQIIWPAIGDECNIVGSRSQIVCVTETAFKVSLDDPLILTCPSGSVCVNQPQVCANNLPPVCRTARCGICLPGANGTCFSKNQYSSCDENGNPSGEIIFCPPSQPYCMLNYTDGFSWQGCAFEPVGCNEEPIFPTTPPPPSPCPTDPLPPPEFDVCTTYGVFRSKTDPTCKRYYYCNYSNGLLVKDEYVCSGNYLFHPDKKKCVLPKDFQCDY